MWFMLANVSSVKVTQAIAHGVTKFYFEIVRFTLTKYCIINTKRK